MSAQIFFNPKILEKNTICRVLGAPIKKALKAGTKGFDEAVLTPEMNHSVSRVETVSKEKSILKRTV